MSEYEWEEADKTNPWGKKRKRGSHCTKGHEFTEENTFIRAYDKARVCRECRKQYAREKYQRNKEQNNGLVRQKKSKQAIFEIPESANLDQNVSELWYNLTTALTDTITPCKIQGPEKYADKPETVSEDEAELLCAGCPLLKQCYDFAVASKQEWGIWGGINFTKEEMIYEFDE